MKKTELKRMLKPLVKQCLKEALLEDGILSSVVTEVVTGLTPLLVEANTRKEPQFQIETTRKQQKLLEQQRLELEEEKRRSIKEQKRKLLDATGFGTEIFEGTEPLSSGGALNAPPSAGPLSNIEPGDPGVDISGLISLGGHKWNKLV
tara:strand:+ start:515 stop:958 length:444 start_codon:yes stop_codon:yes gene_type:complete